MELILVRHPAVAIEPGICYGQNDVPLAAPAGPSVTELARRLEYVTAAKPHRIDTSPLSRCASVAALLAGRQGLSAHEDADLKELDYGAWEMTRWDAVERAQLDAWAADLEHGRPHGGESAAMLAGRAERWLARSRAACPPSASILAVTHAGVIRMLASRLLGEPIAVSLGRPLGYGAICRFVRVSAGGSGGEASLKAEEGPDAIASPAVKDGPEAMASLEAGDGPEATASLEAGDGPKATTGLEAKASLEAKADLDAQAGRWQLADWNV